MEVEPLLPEALELWLVLLLGLECPEPEVPTEVAVTVGAGVVGRIPVPVATGRLVGAAEEPVAEAGGIPTAPAGAPSRVLSRPACWIACQASVDAITTTATQVAAYAAALRPRCCLTATLPTPSAVYA